MISIASLALTLCTTRATSASSLTAATTTTSCAAGTFGALSLTTWSVGICVANSLTQISLPSVNKALQSGLLWYLALLESHPVLTKSLTAGVIGIWGDHVAQWLQYKLLNRERKRHQRDESLSNSRRRIDAWTRLQQLVTIRGSYDGRRGLSYLADGVLISGPLMHFGYELFEKILPIAQGANSSPSLLAAFVHVVADSVLLDSVFVASTFLFTGIFEGYSLRQLGPQFRKDYIPTLKASWLTSAIVMPIELVCFRFLPLSCRVLAVNLIDVVWDAVISFMAHKSRSGHSLHHSPQQQEQHQQQEELKPATPFSTVEATVPKEEHQDTQSRMGVLQADFAVSVTGEPASVCSTPPLLGCTTDETALGQELLKTTSSSATESFDTSTCERLRDNGAGANTNSNIGSDPMVLVVSSAGSALADAWMEASHLGYGGITGGDSTQAGFVAG